MKKQSKETETQQPRPPETLDEQQLDLVSGGYRRGHGPGRSSN